VNDPNFFSCLLLSLLKIIDFDEDRNKQKHVFMDFNFKKQNIQ